MLTLIVKRITDPTFFTAKILTYFHKQPTPAISYFSIKLQPFPFLQTKTNNNKIKYLKKGLTKHYITLSPYHL